MNANESMSVSLYGKMTAVFVVVLLAFSSFTLLASAGPNDEQENEADSGITLGEAVLAPSEEGVEAYHVANMVVPDQEEPIVTVMADGSFKPARQDAGQAKILLVDDDGENWMSGPWLEASHIATALNDGGYSYDVYRAGRWGGTPKELPGGDTGLSMLDDYEAIIWYSGWNTQIFSSAETGILGQYLDGHCGETDSEFGDGDFCVPVTSRNMILSTQMTDWVDAYSGGFENQYFHSDTQSSSYLIVDGTSNPMKGVDDSIFEGEELATDSAGLHYLDRPCGIKPYDDTAIGAFWYDAHKDAPHGHEWHAVQFPGPNYAGGDGQQDGLQDHKAFHFADEIGVFNLRSDRAKFFATILSWMEVTQETTKNVDIGIGGVDIPNHVQYWRSVEAMVPVDIKITVTNYGMLPQASTAVHLKLKNEFGQVLFDSTFDTRAFPEGHAMHIPDQISPGDSVIFTFNKENDRLQRIYDGVNENNARDVIFTSAGMDKIVAEVVHAGDQGSPNNYVQAEVGIGKWIENGEHPDNEIGPSITFGDETGGTHANSPSLDHVNFHRTTSYDTDADGCGWAVDADTCLANGGTLNKTYGTVFMEGESSLGMATSKGWYKSGSDKSCQWGSSSLSDSGCPKFTMEPNQDDWFVSPPLDLSAMDEVVVGMLFSGCMESGDYFRMQISKDGTTWTNLISYTGFCPGEGAWYLWGGSNAKYQGYTLASSWYGEGAETVWWRVQADADNDQNTESSSRPYNGWWIDEIVFRGTEQITRDVAISDITVDNDFAVTDNKGSSLWREINATLVNAGESDWTSVGVQFSVTDMQGYDHSGLLEGESLNEQQIATVQNLDGDSIYGNFIAKPEENELFAVFGTPEANTYTATVEALVPEARDYFPWNNSLSVQFRVFDTFFYDNVDDARTYIDDKGTEDSSDDTTVPIYAYTKVERQSTSDNEWKMRDINNNAYSGEMIWQYSKDGDTSTYGAGADDSLVTQDMYDRDGHTGTEFALDVNVDLRAAFKPYLGYALKWDFADGDRLEVRAAADFDSDQAMSSGTWTVLKTYDGECSDTDWVQEGGNPCTWDSSESEHWVVEELSLEAFEGYQTWIDFRVVTATGGGTQFKGVQLDDIMVIGNEYRNNLAIVDVTTERYAASGETHDLSITVRGVGKEPQADVVVKATITDSNGIRVWPGDPDQPFQFTTIPVELGKGEEYTIDPTTAGTDWIWGFTGDGNDVPLSPGIYYLRIEAKRAQDTGAGEGTSDENPSDNVRTISIVIGATLLNGDQWGDGEGETPDIRTGAEMGDGWSKGSYVWDGIQNGDLTSDVFEVWNEKPFLVVEAEYDLTDAVVIAQVRAGSSGAWYDIHWRAADQLSTLYSIPGDNRTDLPDSWTGSSSFDNATKQTFFADLGVVEDLTNSEGTAL
ncbi:MAG: hypothetical protein VYE50_00045, partial [Candidatus Thermoplasmatota archaeon]|nr:hypothetical protein [Candidatus Thermoplasmatota archaeon]